MSLYCRSGRLQSAKRDFTSPIQRDLLRVYDDLMRSCLIFGLLHVALWAAPPRPEYPEPQFEREQWQNLNGAWEFEFDDANAGLGADWAAGNRKFSRSITVPFCFESKASGIGDTSFHPWVWYRRELIIPDEWKGKQVLLHFGAVDYRAMVWVNGKLAGTHEGGNVPFAFNMTALLKAGPNAIVVRAEDPPVDRTIPRGKQYWEPKSHGIFYTRTSGIWQTVWMEPVSETHLQRVRITTTADGGVRFDATIERPEDGVEFRAAVMEGGKVVASGTSRGSSTAVSVQDPQPWLPQSPYLYEVVLELRRGDTIIDRVNSYFGF